jgi:hypothetical protein
MNKSALDEILELDKSIVMLPITQRAVLELLLLIEVLRQRIEELEEKMKS